MKQITIFIFFTLVLGVLSLLGQEKITVSVIKKGIELKTSDIDFLNVVSLSQNKENALIKKNQASVNGKIYHAGNKLSGKDAKAINKAIEIYITNYKEPDESRGAGWCCIWYYYCPFDDISKCGTYKYCYVC